MKQHNTLLIIIGILATILIAGYIYQNNQEQTPITLTPPITDLPKVPENNEDAEGESTQPSGGTQTTEKAGADPRNTTYTIEGQEVTLVDGEAEIPVAPGSASTMNVSVFSDSTNGDLNSDEYLDNAVMLNVTTGGSGSFFYIAAAIQNSDLMYEGTNAVLVGDRIAPQTNQIIDQEIIVNYADRAEGESMDTKPSVGVTKYYVYENDLLSEKPAQ